MMKHMKHIQIENVLQKKRSSIFKTDRGCMDDDVNGFDAHGDENEEMDNLTDDIGDDDMLDGRVYDDVNNVVVDGIASGNGDRDMEDEILTTDELSSGVNAVMIAAQKEIASIRESLEQYNKFDFKRPLYEQEEELCYDCVKYEINMIN